MTENISVNSFLREGYLILDLFDAAELDLTTKLIYDRVEGVRQSIKGEGGKPEWTLADYHKMIGSDDNLHGHLMAPEVRYINLCEELVSPILRGPILDLMDYYWGHQEAIIAFRGHELQDEQEGDYASGFRFVRPGSRDVAGVHVDTYYAANSDTYDKSLASTISSRGSEADMITVWIPVVGFDDRYSLRFAPGSHTMEHPKEAFKKLPEFITRAAEPDYESKFEYIRPILQPGQAIVFHPNLLHGGSFNLGDSTRVSIEARLRNKRFLDRSDK